MSDLRTRIAAALRTAPPLADDLTLAGAVIRELGNLRYEDWYEAAGEAWGIHRRIVGDSTFIPGANL